MTPTFTLTFDTELIWGSFDQIPAERFARLYPDVRGTIGSVLRLLDQYEVSATWAVLGHLFLSECQRDSSGTAHAELVRPRQGRRHGDWYAADPCTDRSRDPLWYGDDILDALQAARTPQEIGCHSFSHILSLRSFAFPRNSEGHHEALKTHGFRAYRGADPTWHAGLPGLIGRAGHLIDQVAALTPPVSQPTETLPGLWNIPGSCLLIHRAGVRALIPMTSRIRKANTGLLRAEATGGVFHLWTHPFNLASDSQFMIAVLDAILREAIERRDRGTLAIEPMGAVAERLSLASPQR